VDGHEPLGARIGDGADLRAACRSVWFSAVGLETGRFAGYP